MFDKVYLLVVVHHFLSASHPLQVVFHYGDHLPRLYAEFLQKSFNIMLVRMFVLIGMILSFHQIEEMLEINLELLGFFVQDVLFGEGFEVFEQIMENVDQSHI